MLKETKKKPTNLFFRLFLLISIALAGVALVQGQSRKELEKLRTKKEKEIAQTKKKLDQTIKKKQKSEVVLLQLRKQIAQKRELSKIYTSELEKIEEDILKINNELILLDDEINKLKSQFANLVIQGYKSRHAASKINFLFSANTFPQAIRRFIYLKKLLAFRKQQLALIEHKKEAKANNLIEREKIKADKLGIVNSTELIKLELEQDENDAEVLVKVLQKKESQLLVDLKKKEQAYRKLDAAIKIAIEKEIKLAREREEARRKKELAEKNKKSSGDSKVSEENYLSESNNSGFEEMKNKLPWPLNGGQITQGFGTHQHPTLPDVTVINNGVNISALNGSSVKSVFPGSVSAILQIPGMKNTVLIKHGEYFTVYAKLEEVNVKKGDTVKSGETIGKIVTDTDGKTELHFEIWKGNQRIDPQTMLRAK
ncbi:MAG: peptidoglycan DD-metalloendopeptidase family protein [Flavobacteriales bacterium]|nr:peptidoglycan DD-metalloendopeptidase family protein [Flavobacteriales bacterium]